MNKVKQKAWENNTQHNWLTKNCKENNKFNA